MTKSGKRGNQTHQPKNRNNWINFERQLREKVRRQLQDQCVGKKVEKDCQPCATKQFYRSLTRWPSRRSSAVFSFLNLDFRRCSTVLRVISRFILSMARETSSVT